MLRNIMNVYILSGIIILLLASSAGATGGQDSCEHSLCLDSREVGGFLSNSFCVDVTAQFSENVMLAAIESPNQEPELNLFLLGSQKNATDMTASMDSTPAESSGTEITSLFGEVTVTSTTLMEKNLFLVGNDVKVGNVAVADSFGDITIIQTSSGEKNLFLVGQNVKVGNIEVK